MFDEVLLASEGLLWMLKMFSLLHSSTALHTCYSALDTFYVLNF